MTGPRLPNQLRLDSGLESWFLGQLRGMLDRDSEATFVVIALYGNGFPSPWEAWPILSYPLILSFVV